MRLILLVGMMTLLTSCFENPIDYRIYAFPKATTSYNLINYRDPDDLIKVDVSVQAGSPEQVWVLKDYKKMNTKTLEIYSIGEKEITKTSHKVDGQETMSAPISFPRFIKSKEQFGPKKDSIFGKYGDELLGKCSILDYRNPKNGILVLLSERLGFNILMDGLEEFYCANNGLMGLKINDTQYMVDVRGFNGCEQKKIGSGINWVCSPTR